MLLYSLNWDLSNIKLDQSSDIHKWNSVCQGAFYLDALIQYLDREWVKSWLKNLDHILVTWAGPFNLVVYM